MAPFRSSSVLGSRAVRAVASVVAPKGLAPLEPYWLFAAGSDVMLVWIVPATLDIEGAFVVCEDLKTDINL